MNESTSLVIDPPKQIAPPMPESMMARRLYANALEDERKIIENIRLQRKHLAVAYFQQGRFEEAANTMPESAEKVEKQTYLAAFNALDVPICKCPDTLVNIGTKEKSDVRASKEETERIYVGNMATEIKFIGCYLCKKLFAFRVEG